MFLEKLPIKGRKMHFTHKQKLFKKLWTIVKQMKQLNFQNILFWGDLWGPKMGKKAQNDLIHEPLTPLKNHFWIFSVLQLF